MAISELSAIQFANIAMLFTIQDVGRRNACDAGLMFQLSENELSSLLQLGRKELFELVALVGDVCLFPPRSDFARMLRLGGEPASALAHLMTAMARPTRQAPQE